jgi:hypothetical protein
MFVNNQQLQKNCNPWGVGVGWGEVFIHVDNSCLETLSIIDKINSVRFDQLTVCLSAIKFCYIKCYFCPIPSIYAMNHSLYRRKVYIEAWRIPQNNRPYKHLPILLNPEVVEANPSGTW